MVITVLEAQISADNTANLEAAYKQAVQHLDPGIAQTFLLHSMKEPAVWQIVTVWQTREALDAMRQSGETPRGVLIFRAAGAEPRLSIFEVAAYAMLPVES